MHLPQAPRGNTHRHLQPFMIVVSENFLRRVLRACDDEKNSKLVLETLEGIYSCGFRIRIDPHPGPSRGSHHGAISTPPSSDRQELLHSVSAFGIWWQDAGFQLDINPR